MTTADDVCESLAAFMRDGFKPDEVTVRWGFSLSMDEEKAQGTHIDIFPDPESPVQGDVKTRGGDSWNHTVFVVVWEVCPKANRNPSTETVGQPGKPSRDWMRDRLRWSAQNVFRKFSNERDYTLECKDLDTGDEVGLYPIEASFVTQFDPAAEDRGVFLAQYRLTFREQE